MAVITEQKIGDLTPDVRNANKGTQRGDYMLEESLRRYGAGRSVLLDKHGRIIAGNKTAGKFGEIGMEDVLVVETDGTQLVAVKRTDLDLDDDAARQLAYADNRVSEIDLDFDAAQIAEDLNAGIDLAAFWNPEEIDALMAAAATPPDSFKEFDETVADDVKKVTCPECGHEFPV